MVVGITTLASYKGRSDEVASLKGRKQVEIMGSEAADRDAGDLTALASMEFDIAVLD